MDNDKKDGLAHLALYGSDFRRWPVGLTAQQEHEIRAMPEFQEACKIDALLDEVEWPAPSKTLFDASLARIKHLQAEEKGRSAGMQPFMFLMIKRPVFLVMSFVVFLCLGITSGVQFNAKITDQADYSYFTLGPAYAYGSTAGVFDE